MVRKRKLEQSQLAGSALLSQEPSTVDSTESLVNRRKKSAASRIGRACDRCQHRKLACDPAPEGCPTCVRVDAWCTATDPLTRNPTYRGEFEYLERTVARQRAQIEQLLARLGSSSEDIKAFDDDDPGAKQYLAWTRVKASGDTRPWDREDRQHNSSYPPGPHQIQNGNNLYDAVHREPSIDPSFSLHTSSHEALGLPDLRTGLTGENYLGVSPHNLSLESKPSAKLNMLGWEINIAGLTAGSYGQSVQSHGHNGRSYDRSYQSFIATAFGVAPKMDNVKLPSREEAFRHATGYIFVLNGFLPILHKTSFMDLLGRFYDDSKFQPSAAEKVMVHMMLASMFYHDALRNWENPARRQDLHNGSDIYYHFSLGFFSELMAGHTLQDMQALAMICAHVRTFPTPEAGWVVTCMAFNKAIELGLHKAARPGASHVQPKNILESEMRKRIFWSILAIHVTVSGKLGRPMPIREEDYDVGLPLPIDDDLLQEKGLNTSRKGNCAFLAGIEAFKVEPIFMDLYRNAYAAKRSPKEYTQFVVSAEKRIKAWQDQWPDELRDGVRTDDVTRVFTQYLHLWMCEFRLLLHHPSLSLTRSVQFNETNLRTCLSMSQDMLKRVKELQQLKSLDTTWPNCAVYVLAIQTTLYGHGQFKDELTKEKLDALKSDMEQWLSIMGDIGGLLGTGRRLQSAICEQIDTGVSQLENHLTARTAVAITRDTESMIPPRTNDNSNARVGLSQQDHYDHPNGYGPYGGAARPNSYTPHNGSNPLPRDAPSLNVYASMTGYNYPEPTNSQYTNSSVIPSAYAASPYPVNLASQALSTTYQSQLAGEVTDSGAVIYPPSTTAYANGNTYGADSQSWYQYTQTIPSNIGPQDYNPASALLQLGGRTDSSVNGVGLVHDVSGTYDSSSMSGGAGQMWPFGVVDNTNGGSS